MSADRAPGMVRGWPQLMQSAAELWAVLPPDPPVSADGDPIAILAAMGRAVGRSLAAGHWPGRGPRDEAWPTAATITTPAHYLEVASAAMRLLAEASTTWPESERADGSNQTWSARLQAPAQPAGSTGFSSRQRVQSHGAPRSPPALRHCSSANRPVRDSQEEQDHHRRPPAFDPV